MTVNENTKNLYALLLKGRRRNIAKAEVFQDTSTALEMSVIVTGYVKRYTIKADGTLSIQSIYGPGYFFPLTLAYRLLLNQDILHSGETIYYETMTDAVIYSIDNHSLASAVENDITLYKDLFFVSGRRLHSNIQRLENSSLPRFYNQVAHQLLYFARVFGTQIPEGIRIDLPLTQQDIADVLSSTRETVSIAMSLLKQKDIVTVKNRRCIVKDIDALQAEITT